MATTLIGDAVRAEAGSRPNVLALPSPTTSRFVLLMAALLSSGLFVGTSIHNQTPVAADWLAKVSACEAQRAPGGSVAEMLQAEQAFQHCIAGVQQRLAWYAAGAVLLTLLAAGVVLVALPAVIVRRRGLRPAGPKLASTSQRVALLAADAGLRQPPETMVGPSTLRDAFSYGLPRRYAVALPPALAVRSASSGFEPLVRHELAHLASGDVLIAWSARALWYVVVVVLAVPMVLEVVRGDLGLVPSYAWRAALLLLASVLASAGILRSREYEADLRSARTSAHRDALGALLETSGRGQVAGVRRLVALHPDPSQRVTMLRDPALLARPSAVDAGIAGFLAAITVPLLVSVFATVPSLITWSHVVPAGVVGPVIGATVGVGLWRSALVDVAGGPPVLPSAARRAAIGISLGFLTGQAASLAVAGSSTLTGSRTPLVPLLVALGVGGTSLVVAGVAALVADRSAHLSARTYATLAVAVSAVLFALVLWAVTAVTRALDLGGWSLSVMVAATVLTHPAAGAVAAGLAVVVLVLLVLRPVTRPPGWAVEGEPPPEVPSAVSMIRARQVMAVALVTGIAAASSILVFRLAAGPAADEAQQVQRFDAYVWVFAGAGAAAGLALIALYGLRGAGAGVLAAPLAATAAALGFVLVNSAFGGATTLEFLGAVTRPAPPLGLLLFVLALVLTFLLPGNRVGRRPVWLLLVLPAVLGTAFAVTAISAREVINPLPTASTAVMADDMYVGYYAPTIADVLASVDQAAAAIDRDSGLGPTGRAQRIRADLVDPLSALLEQAALVRPQSQPLLDAHEALLSGLQDSRDAFQNFARAYESGDSDLFRQSQADRANAQRLLAAWLDALNPS